MNTESSMTDLDYIESVFHRNHIIGKGVADMLFQATMGSDSGSITNSVLNANAYAYAMQNSLHEMDKYFVALSEILRDTESQIEEMRTVEAGRQIDIMEIVYEFEDKYPQLKNDAIDAIKDGTSSECFKEHTLRVISMDNRKKVTS